MKRFLRATALLLAALSVAPRVAFAGPLTPAAEPTAAELATARLLFAEALAAQDQGRCVDAIPIYERIAKIAVSPVLYLRIGTCNESLGRVVEALNALELAAQEADKKHDAEVAKEARAHLAKLRPKVARLAVQVPEGADGVEISIDGRAVSAALAGTTMLVDPGRRHVVVRAANYEKAFEADVSAAAEQPATVTADLGKKKVAAPPALAAIAIAPKPAAEAVKALQPEAVPDRFPGAVAGGVTAGVGIAALISGLIAHAKFDEFLMENANPRPGTRAAREQLHDSGQAAALVSTVLTGAFVVGAGFTVVLLANPPRKTGAATARRAALAPWIAMTGGGLVVRGEL
jgi:tetratricopeptide (TPR) repeat protein